MLRVQKRATTGGGCFNRSITRCSNVMRRGVGVKEQISVGGVSDACSDRPDTRSHRTMKLLGNLRGAEHFFGGVQRSVKKLLASDKDQRMVVHNRGCKWLILFGLWMWLEGRRNRGSGLKSSQMIDMAMSRC
jgi:hypothetical protein